MGGFSSLYYTRLKKQQGMGGTIIQNTRFDYGEVFFSLLLLLLFVLRALHFFFHQLIR